MYSAYTQHKNKLDKKIKKYLSQEHRIQFYKSYIQPHIDFCSIVWGSSSESNKCKIFKLQKRACKVILDYSVDNSSEAMQSLKIMSIYDRLYLRKAKFMFKIFNNTAPVYISENFTLRNNVNTSINLRSSAAACSIPPKPRTEYYKHSLRYSGCLVWNSLLVRKKIRKRRLFKKVQAFCEEKVLRYVLGVFWYAESKNQCWQAEK